MCKWYLSGMDVYEWSNRNRDTFTTTIQTNVVAHKFESHEELEGAAEPSQIDQTTSRPTNTMGGSWNQFDDQEIEVIDVAEGLEVRPFLPARAADTQLRSADGLHVLELVLIEERSRIWDQRSALSRQMSPTSGWGLKPRLGARI